MKKKLWFTVSALLLIIFLAAGCGGNNSHDTKNNTRAENLIIDESVIINNKNSYYEVIFDFNSGKTHYDIGREYGRKISQEVPDIENLLDSYIVQVSFFNYDEYIRRVNDIKPQLAQEYIDELDGLAEIASTKENVAGDGLISADEIYLLNLLPDVLRGTQCSALSVFGDLSETGKNMVARNLDWFPGIGYELCKIHSVLTIKNGTKSICTIGYLGLTSILSGFNDDGVFASILDSNTGSEYSSNNKYSYVFDLRYALENYSTLAGIADYMDEHSYAFNHLVFLSDEEESKVLENNFSGNGVDMHKGLRSYGSVLNPGVTWDLVNAIACVNSFILKGNHDNHTGKLSNTGRWNSIKTLLNTGRNNDGIVSLTELKNIACFYTGDIPDSPEDGDLYNIGTLQIIVFQPDSFNLEIFFQQPFTMPDVPTFNKVSVKFE